MTSLIELQRNHILNLVKSIKTNNGYKALILDNTTWSLVFEVCEPNELLDIVIAVDKIDERRQSRSGIDAIYILEPTQYSVNCLLTDYQVVPVRYKGAHIFFLPGLTSEISNTIKANRQLQKHLLSFQEFHLSIYPKEASVFTTHNPQSLQIFYNKECHDLVTKTVVKTATSLVNVCVLTGEYPIIRYYSPNEHDGYFNASILPKMIASEFQDQLDNYTRSHPDFPPASTRQRSIFVVSDRTLDLFAPLLHEFTYQAMAYDLRDLKDDTYEYEAENERGEKESKISKLNDNDTDWVQLRHLHILDAQEVLSSRLEEFLSKNQMLVDRSHIKSTSDILTAVARLKGFDEERRRIILHKTLIEDLLLTNGEKKLVELAEFEQNLASFGVDIDGERVKNLADQLIELLDSEKYTLEEKLRLIILYGLYRGGLIEKDYVKVFSFIGILQQNQIEKSLDSIKNFETIGFKLIKPNLKSKSIFKKTLYHESISEGSFNTSRFRPSINSIITKIISNTLDDETFPYIKDKPIDLESDISRTNSTSTTSLKNPKHKPAWAKTNTQFQPPRQRIFYFIAGGATHSELRTAYELSTKFDKDIIVGSDEILNSKQFLAEVKHLSYPRQDLKLYLDWKNNGPIKPPKFLLENQQEKRTPTPVVAPVTTTVVQTSPNKLESKPTTTSLTGEALEKSGKRSRFKKFLKG